MKRALAVVVVMASAACGAALLTYPLEGQLYDAEKDCLDEEGVIDVIEGEPTGTCEGVRCFYSRENGDYVVTAMCKPPTYYDDQSAGGGPCTNALAAYALGAEGRCTEEDPP